MYVQPHGDFEPVSHRENQKSSWLTVRACHDYSSFVCMYSCWLLLLNVKKFDETCDCRYNERWWRQSDERQDEFHYRCRNWRKRDAELGEAAGTGDIMMPRVCWSLPGDSVDCWPAFFWQQHLWLSGDDSGFSLPPSPVWLTGRACGHICSSPMCLVHPVPQIGEWTTSKSRVGRFKLSWF